MKLWIATLLVAFSVSACGQDSGSIEPLKSPCVGANDSPCGPKRPANPWIESKENA